LHELITTPKDLRLQRDCIINNRKFGEWQFRRDGFLSGAPQKVDFHRLFFFFASLFLLKRKKERKYSAYAVNVRRLTTADLQINFNRLIFNVLGAFLASKFSFKNIFMPKKRKKVVRFALNNASCGWLSAFKPMFGNFLKVL
jgi:hypothetical protein